MTARDVVFPPGRQALYERNRYSPAIRANGLLFVSGQVGSRPLGEAVALARLVSASSRSASRRTTRS